MTLTSFAAVLAFLLTLAGPAGVSGPPFELAVRQDHFFGSTRGTLVVGPGGIEFKTTNPKESHRWEYRALRQVRVLSTTRIVVDTYEEPGGLRLGADRSYAFKVTAGAIPADLVEFLLGRLERPTVTAVMPPLPSTALFEVPVHARAGRGSDGRLVLYDDGVAYLTERDGEARYWRFRDVFAVLKLDRYRVQVLAYEGGPGETRPFTFELTSELPQAMYDAIWQRVNDPGRRFAGPGNDPGRRFAPSRSASNESTPGVISRLTSSYSGRATRSA